VYSLKAHDYYTAWSCWK